MRTNELVAALSLAVLAACAKGDKTANDSTANKARPKIEMHLKRAQDIGAKLGVAATP